MNVTPLLLITGLLGNTAPLPRRPAAPPPSNVAVPKIVTSLTTYGAIAREIVGDKGTVTSIAQGNEDPHFVQPKPSFVAVLRTFAAFLAGTNRMPWPRFLLYNAAGGIVWATLFGLGGYFLGDNIHRLTGPIGISSIVLAVIFIIAFLLFLRRNEQRLEDEAERALPGSLDTYQPGGAKDK